MSFTNILPEDSSKKTGCNENTPVFDDLKVLFTRSQPTEIPTAHGKIAAGGAIFDDRRRIIVSTAWEENRCCDIFITRFVDPIHGTSERLTGRAPFSSGDHPPIYDGERYVYFMEHSWGDNGKRFGRLNLDSMSFEELKPLDTGKKFAVVFSGCYHNGKIYGVESNGEPKVSESEIIEYNVSENKWSRTGIKFFSEKDHVAWRLLSDPLDKQHIYAINYCEGRGLYQIDLEAHSYSLVQLLPVPSDAGTYDCLLIRENPAHFYIIAVFGGLWYYYSSQFNAWALLQWKKPAGREGWNYNYLVFSTTTKTFYFHSKESLTWDAVQL